MANALVQRSFLSLLGWHYFWMDPNCFEIENHNLHQTLNRIARTIDTTNNPIGIYIKITKTGCNKIHQIVFDVMTNTANVLKDGQPPLKLITILKPLCPLSHRHNRL